MKTMLLIVVAINLSSCASSPPLYKLTPGMTKYQVVDIMGEPKILAGVNNAHGCYAEIWEYSYLESGWSWQKTYYNFFFCNGVLTEFGDARMYNHGPDAVIEVHHR